MQVWSIGKERRTWSRETARGWRWRKKVGSERSSNANIRGDRDWNNPPIRIVDVNGIMQIRGGCADRAGTDWQLPHRSLNSIHRVVLWIVNRPFPVPVKLKLRLARRISVVFAASTTHAAIDHPQRFASDRMIMWPVNVWLTTDRDYLLYYCWETGVAVGKECRWRGCCEKAVVLKDLFMKYNFSCCGDIKTRAKSVLKSISFLKRLTRYVVRRNCKL